MKNTILSFKPETIVIFLLILMSFYSCRPYVFIQSAPVVPLIDNKKQYQINNLLLGNKNEIQTSGSPINHWGYIFNYTDASGNFNNDNTSIELGAGYYKKLKNQHLFDCYLGIGKASIIDTFQYNLIAHFMYSIFYKWKISANYTKYFIQPTYCFYNKKNIKIAATLKMSYLNYKNYEIKLIPNNSEYLSNDTIIIHSFNHKGFLLFEPVITLRAGSIVQFVSQIGYSISNKNYYTGFSFDANKVLMNNHSYNPLDHLIFKMGLSVNLDFNKRNK